MAKVVILGAGLAGISAAINLSNYDYDITIIEQSNKAGGKVKSAYNPITKTYYDIGQHLLISGYEATLKYLNIINSQADLLFFDKIYFYGKNNQLLSFKLDNNFFPIKIIYNLLTSRIINYNDVIDVFKLFYTRKINSKIITNFVKSIYNTDTADVPLKSLGNTFKIITKKNNFYPILPKNTLEETLITPALEYLFKKNVKINYNERFINFKTEDNLIKEIITNKNKYYEFDYLISALPYNVFSSLFTKNNDFKMNTIQTIYYFTNNELSPIMIGNLNDDLWDWIFAYNNHISIVTSNYRFNDFNEIYFQNFIKNIFGNLKIIDKKIINFKNATPFQDNNFEKNKKIKLDYRNLKIIGDWTIKNLPCTIETAIMSGFKLAL